LASPDLPRTCSVAPTQCVHPTTDAGASTAICQIPRDARASATLEVFTEAAAIGLPITWTSARGLTVPVSPSRAIQQAVDGEAGCSSVCGIVCSGESRATVVGAASAGAGIDEVIATAAGYPAPIASVTVAVQGPPQITLVSSSVGVAPGLVVVENPMGFSQKCTFGLPAGVQVSRLRTQDVDASELLGTCALPLADVGCIVSSQFTETTQVYSVSFAPESDAAATANGPTTSVSIACSDTFGQVATATLSATRPPAPEDGDAGADEF
jgi:hypothetical protein